MVQLPAITGLSELSFNDSTLAGYICYASYKQELAKIKRTSCMRPAFFISQVLQVHCDTLSNHRQGNDNLIHSEAPSVFKASSHVICIYVYVYNRIG